MYSPLRRLPSAFRRPFCLFAAAVALCLPCPARADVTGEQVKQALRKGVAALRGLQKDDGSWPERHQPGGETCLATLALLQAGESTDSPAVAAGLAKIVPISGAPRK
jgi:hypothetical protein